MVLSLNISVCTIHVCIEGTRDETTDTILVWTCVQALRGEGGGPLCNVIIFNALGPLLRRYNYVHSFVN